MLIPTKIKLTNRILYKVTKPVTFENTVQLGRLSRLMHEFVQAHNAIGLAANQIGVNCRLFVMRTPSITVTCFNPKILSVSDETIFYEEGCLSFPKDTALITRFVSINVQFQDTSGNTFIEDFTGLPSICFQHELDHCNGITMHMRASGL